MIQEENKLTTDIHTTNKVLACYLRYMGHRFALSNGNSNPYIVTFHFTDVPLYQIDEFYNGTPAVRNFRNIYNVRKLVNDIIDQFRRENIKR